MTKLKDIKTQHQESEHDPFGIITLLRAPNGNLYLHCLCSGRGGHAFDEWEVVREAATKEDLEQFGRESVTEKAFETERIRHAEITERAKSAA